MRLDSRWALVAICLGYFMTILDTTIVNVALADLARQLHVDLEGLQWIVDGYALTFASLLLSAGALGDRLGNRNTFIGGLILFTLASALCGWAPTLSALVAARVLQGLGAALMVPASLALLRQSFVQPAERARAIGGWAAVAGVGAASGPVLGGFLVTALSWRSIFLVNLPIGALAVFLSARFLPRASPAPPRKLDWAGQALGVVTLGALTFALIHGRSLGWSSPPILLALATAAAGGAGFAWVERRVEHPMLPLKLFRQSNFSSANAVGFLLNFGFYGELFALSLFLQQARGDSPMWTGLALLPQTGVLLIGNALSGRITARSGPRGPMLWGLLLSAVGFLPMALVGVHTPYGAMAAPLVAIGFGTALTMPAMTTAAIDATPADQTGIGSGILNASRQVGGVLGIALLGAMLNGPAGLVTGMRWDMVIASAAFLFGAWLTWRGVTAGPAV